MIRGHCNHRQASVAECLGADLSLWRPIDVHYILDGGRVRPRRLRRLYAPSDDLIQEPMMNAPIGKSLEPLIGYRIDDSGCVESRMFEATELPEGWVDTPARLPRSCERIVFNGSLIALNELGKNIERLDIDMTVEPAGMVPSASHAVEHRPADLRYPVEPVRLDYFVVFEANDPPVLEMGPARVRCPKP